MAGGGSSCSSLDQSGGGKLRVYLINIRANNPHKFQELLSAIEADAGRDSLTIICLTEPQEKFERVHVPERYKYAASRRDWNDKKGGGLLILFDRAFEFLELNSQSCNVLITEIEINKEKVTLVLVYVDCVDENRNAKIYDQLNTYICSHDELNKLIVLGVFNGHLGFIGSQELNRNGRRVLELMESHNLVLLNGDDRCQGEVTRKERDVESAIDFMLVNEKMYNGFVNMYVDEAKSIFDLSDHCILKADFKLRMGTTTGTKLLQENTNYYSVGEELKGNFIDVLESRLRRGEDLEDMEQFEKIVKESMDNNLKRSYIKRRKKGKLDPVWFTKEIRENIKLRKQYNRAKDATQDPNEREQFWKLYIDKKNVVKKLVKESINRYELKITGEIRERGRTRDLWRNINILRGGNKCSDSVAVYNQMGEVLCDVEARDSVLKYWKNIYQKIENEIEVVWNYECRESYLRELELDTERRENLNSFEPINIELQNWVSELMRRIGQGQAETRADGRGMIDGITNMSRVFFTEEEVKKQLVKMKSDKQPGPDLIKTNIYKWMGDSRLCIETLCRCLNKIIRTGHIPEQWKNSKTTLIQKKSKPNCADFRPIALTNTSYKIFMGLLKEKLFRHLKEQGCVLELQAGFTGGRRLEDNILILKYCISARPGRRLHVVAGDTCLQQVYERPPTSLSSSGDAARVPPWAIAPPGSPTSTHTHPTQRPRWEATWGALGRPPSPSRLGGGSNNNNCISESFRMKRPLYVCAIDFAKAFDSIDRKQIVNCLQRYRCDSNVIEAVTRIYSGDYTALWLNGEEVGRVSVFSGIRQGCTGSPWIFVMILNSLIEGLIKTRCGFRN